MIPDFERISAGFLVKDKKVFVAQRDQEKDQPLKWELPGRKLKDNEHYDETLVHEFQEEFQINIEVLKEIGGAEVNLSNKVLIVMFFLIDGDANNIKLTYHKDSKFVTLQELKSLDLCSADKSFIEKYEEELREYID